MPKKSVLAPSKLIKIEQRKSHLSQFLAEIVQRQDIMTSQEAFQFFEFDKNCPELVVQMPQLIHNITTKFPIVDFCFQPEQDLLVLGITDLGSNSKFVHGVQNTKWPWQNKSLRIKSPMSEAIIYQIIPEIASSQPKIIFRAIFKNQLTAVNWDANLSQLAAGLIDGNILIFQLDLKSEVNQANLPQLADLYNIEQALPLKNVAAKKHHQEAIISIGVDLDLSLLITISKDKKLNIVDSKTLELIGSLHIMLEQLTSLYVDQQRHWAYVGNQTGIVSVFDFSKQTPHVLFKFSVINEMPISSIYVDIEQNYIFITSENQYSTVFFKSPGEAPPSKLIEFQTRAANSSICWTKETKEVFIGDQDGNLTV